MSNAFWGIPWTGGDWQVTDHVVVVAPSASATAVRRHYAGAMGTGGGGGGVVMIDPREVYAAYVERAGPTLRRTRRAPPRMRHTYRPARAIGDTPAPRTNALAQVGAVLWKANRGRRKTRRLDLRSNPTPIAAVVEFIAVGGASFIGTKLAGRMAAARITSRHAAPAATVGMFVTLWMLTKHVQSATWKRRRPALMLGSGLAALDTVGRTYFAV